MRQVKTQSARGRSSGFTLFEMVVTICSVVLLYMVAEQRLNDLPAAAERANFHAVLQQIKTGVGFEMATKVAAGQTEQITLLEGTNPMNLLIEAPSNYGGELESVTDAVPRRNAWYFETSTGELVFVVGGASVPDVDVLVGGIAVKLGQIRLKVMNVYSAGGSPQLIYGIAQGRAAGGKWQGLLLTPVREYTWYRRDLTIPAG